MTQAKSGSRHTIFFPASKLHLIPDSFLRLREISWVTPAVWGNAREGKRLGCFQLHMHLPVCEHPPPRRVYHGLLILRAALAPVVEKLPSVHAFRAMFQEEAEDVPMPLAPGVARRRPILLVDHIRIGSSV